MKNKSLFIFLLALLPSLSFSQITIDSVKVYHSTSTVDSVYISCTTTGQSFAHFSIVPFTDVCPTLWILCYFEGCGPTTPMPFDTMLVYGNASRRVEIFTIWDTTAACSTPTEVTSTDSLLWQNCTSTSTENLDASMFRLYPNPAQHTVQLELPADIQVQRLSLSDVSGRMLRQYGPQQRSLEVTGLPPGLYFLRVESDRGAVVKRLVVE